MPSWKKILQSGSAVHVLNITASSLPNVSQPNIIGYDTASGRFTFFSTSSLVNGGSVIGGSGTTNYITRWSSSTLITTSSIYESGSRIGIGTTSSLAKLHVRGVGITSETEALRVENSNTSASLVVLDDRQTRITSDGAALFVQGAGVSPYTQNIAEFKYAGNGNSIIISQQEGVAGLTTSANANLNISPSGSGSTVFLLGKEVRLNNSNNNGTIALKNTGLTGEARLDFITGSSTIMSISSSGNVGIGTTTPTAELHISGASNSNLLRVDSPSASNALFVSGSGRVGIGTGTPNATLQIAGTLNNGSDSTPSGIYSHTEGALTIAVGYASHAEGQQTTASGSYSHTEGALTIAVGYASHAEGFSTNASGSYSHAEGWGTIARGHVSHAEGLNTLASGLYSHAEGFSTNAGGEASHAEGWGTITSASFQYVQGQNNRPTQKQSAFIIGNGSTNNNAARKNLVEINPTDNISDFFGPVRITRTEETSTQDPDTLRDQNKAGIIYMGFKELFNTPSRGPSPPIAVKINNTATGGTNYGTLRHPFTDGATSAINPAYALLKIDNAQYNSPSPSLGVGRTSNPFNVVNTGIFTDGAVTAQEFRALGSWAISQTSDIRLKKNIENLDINTALRLVENVKPVTFNWNRPDTNDAFDRINGSFDVGVIAQDVLKNGFDHLVRTAKNEKMPEHIGEDGEISEKGYEFSVSYVGMIPYHAKVIKYLLDEVKELKSEIERLRKNGNT